MNEIYKNELTIFLNYFIPSVKLLEKTRIGSKQMRKFDRPKTPYQRVLECGYISKEVKQRLMQTRENLNPFELIEKI
jgi:hypothetical protein